MTKSRASWSPGKDCGSTVTGWTGGLILADVHIIGLVATHLPAIPDEGTDFGALEQGYVSITPLHLDLTDFQALKLARSN